MRLFNGNKRLVAVDFGSSEIKMIEGQVTKGSINVTKSSAIPIISKAYDDGKIQDMDSISNAISNDLKKSKINKDLQGVAVINSSAIITREVNIPKVDTSEVDPLLGYQISEFLPIDPDDYVVNHLPIATTLIDGLEKLRILLVAIPKGVVVSHLELMRASNLKPEVLDFQGNSIAKLLNFNSTINGNYSISGKTIASVDVGYMSTNVAIIKDGKIEVTRTFKMGAATIYKSISELFGITIDEAEEKVKSIEDINITNEEFDDYHRMINLTRTLLETLMENIQSVVRYYTSRSPNNKVDLILLQGGFSNLNGLCEMFLESQRVETLKLESLDKVKFNGDLSLYANAIGGLIRRDGVKR